MKRLIQNGCKNSWFKQIKQIIPGIFTGYKIQNLFLETFLLAIPVFSAGTSDNVRNIPTLRPEWKAKLKLTVTTNVIS